MSRLGVALLAVALAAGVGDARQTYFEIARGYFGIPTDSRIDACGICHKRWMGTGARNDFGTAVEQQLYAGKSVPDAFASIEGLDSDGDGFTNRDELITWLTLPGFSCTNFAEAVGAPLDYHTFITPMVASCLPPLDIRVSQAEIAFLAEGGRTEQVPLTIYNNGTDVAVAVASYGLAPASGPFAVDGPAAPFDIPVGGQVTLTLTFAPPGPAIASARLDIVSNDPDESPLAVTLSGIGFSKSLAPAEQRAACRKSLARTFRRFSTLHLDAWLGCYEDEARGVACRAGARDRAVARAAARLRLETGGARDRACAGRGLVPATLDLPGACGGGCGAIALTSLSAFADCLVCRQQEETDRLLVALVGARPPDLPSPGASAREPAACVVRQGRAVRRAVEQARRTLDECLLRSIGAATPVDCGMDTATALAALAEEVDATVEACATVPGLATCAYQPKADPACLGTAATDVGAALSEAVFLSDR